MPLPQKHFYVIRHGQTEANAAQRLAGFTDSPLTDLGRKQAEIARAAVESLPIKPSHIVHSHLSRARDTAHIINQNLGLPMTETPDIGEINAGDWEGQPKSIWWDDLLSYVDPPNGETFDTFHARVKRGFSDALNSLEGRPLFVCHGGVMRALNVLYDVRFEHNILNCHLHEYEPFEDRASFPWRVWHYDVCEIDGHKRVSADAIENALKAA